MALGGGGLGWDPWHHGKEEDQLFLLMAERLDYPRDAGPIAVLTNDHRTARTLVRGMAEALEMTDTRAATTRLVKDGRAYAHLLRAHIDREDDKRFETALPPIDAAALLAKLALR